MFFNIRCWVRGVPNGKPVRLVLPIRLRLVVVVIFGLDQFLIGFTSVCVFCGGVFCIGGIVC